MAQIQDATGNPILANVEASGAFAALNDEALVTLFGQAVAAVQIAGLAGAITIIFEGSVDGTNYQSIMGTRKSDGLTAVSTTANGLWSVGVGGFKKFRARVSAVAGGTATANVIAGQGVSEPPFGGAVTVSGTVAISAVSLPLPTGASTSALQTQPGVDIGDVTVNNAVGAAAVNIQDGGNSITVDAVSLPLPTGAATSALQTQPGVDIGDVTVNNAAGAAAVNIQDGGNSITVDSTQLPAALAAGGGLKVEGVAGGVAQPISAVSLPLPTGASTSALQTQPGVDIGDVTINNAAGAAAVNIQDGGNSITVDGTVAVSGAVDTELPAAAALADAAANPTAPAVGAFNMVWNGATWDRIPGSAANGIEVQGSVANAVADAGNPVGQGLQARTTNPTAVADGQRVTQKSDKLGRAVVAVGQVRDLITQNTITLTTTTETTLVAAVAAVFNDLCSLILTNTSATGVRVDFRDATAGTVWFSVFLAANGGGAVINPTRPYKQTAVNNNWTAQLSAAVTDVRIFAQVEQNL